MIESGRRREIAQTIGSIMLAGGLAGALYGLFFERFHITTEILQGAATGLVLGFVLASIDAALMFTRTGEWIRSARFGVLLSIRTSIYVFVIVSGLILSDIVFDRDSMSEVMADDSFGHDIAFALTIAITVNFVILLRGLLGQRVLSNFLLGRYHTPVIERRVFLVVDLIDSTGMAERLGDSRFLELLNQFFTDIAAAVLETRGEIYKYVGDAVIISWSEVAARRSSRCLVCYIEMRRRLEARAGRYIERFGEAPRFRAALHGGPVAAGEIGDLKREIVFLGDTLNATFRIEELCKAHGVAGMASAATVAELQVPDGIRLEPIDDVVLRGKSGPTGLVAFDLTR